MVVPLHPKSVRERAAIEGIIFPLSSFLRIET
jgi:hypothetical protein